MIQSCLQNWPGVVKSRLNLMMAIDPLSMTSPQDPNIALTEVTKTYHCLKVVQSSMCEENIVEENKHFITHQMYVRL